MHGDVTVNGMHCVPLDQLADLIAESEAEGYRFLVRMRAEWESGLVRFDRPGEVCFTASADGRVIGVCGLTADPYVDDPSIGRVRKLYVSEAHRRRGTATKLLRALCVEATDRFRQVRVRTQGVAACAFYESLGFRAAAPGVSYTHFMTPQALEG